MLPFTFKLLMGLIIDARLVSKRRYYLIFFGVTSIITQYCIGFGETGISEPFLVTMLILYNFGAAFLDATIDSVSIQQARVDIDNG
jgi:hypothetical protein